MPALHRGLLAGLLVTVPLAFDIRQGYDATRPKYLLLLLGGVAAAVLLLAGAVTGERPWRANWLSAPVTVFVLVNVVSTVASRYPRTAVFGFPGLRHGLLTTVSLAAVFFASSAAGRDDGSRRLLETLWFGAGSVVLLFGLGQLQDRIVSPNQGWNWARPAVSPWTIGSTLGNPNHLASFLAMLLPVAVVLGALAAPRQRRLVIGMVAVLIVELGITASRAGLLGAVAGVCVLGLLLRRDLAPHRRVVVRLTGAAVALTLLAVVVFGATGVAKVKPDRLLRSGPGSTLDLRIEVWGAAWRMAGDHPVVGVGPDVFPVLFPAYASARFMLLFGPFTVANGAHNTFFDTLADLGVVGLVALVWLLSVAARGVARAWQGVPAEDRERRLLLGGTAASLAAFVAQACFNTDEIALSLCFWALLGLAVALSQHSRALAQ